MLTKATNAIYDPKALCPRWLQFLDRVLPSQDVRDFMQRSVGYALTDLTSEQCLWFLYGTGRNGRIGWNSSVMCAAFRSTATIRPCASGPSDGKA